MGSDTDDTAAAQPDGREDDGQEYVDRSKIDFDPDDGLYTGTAVEGTSDIPGSLSSDGDGDDGDGNDDGEQTEDEPEMADPEPA